MHFSCMQSLNLDIGIKYLQENCDFFSVLLHSTHHVLVFIDLKFNEIELSDVQEVMLPHGTMYRN